MKSTSDQNELNEEINKVFKNNVFNLEASNQKVGICLQSLTYRWPAFSMVNLIENRTQI